MAGALIVFLGRSRADADSPYMIGVDMRPEMVGASSAQGIQSCIEVDVGDEFTIDIFVSNAQALTAWELRVNYNPDLVAIEEADFNHFLVSQGGNIFPSLFEHESAGRHFLAAVDIKGPAESGSGTLARLRLRGLNEGVSSISIARTPSYFGPRLTSQGGAPMGDIDGDGIFDGDLRGGEVAIGRSCAPSAPVITPAPIDPIDPTVPGTQIPTPTTAGGNPGEGGSGEGGDSGAGIPNETAASGVIVIDPGDASGSGDSGSEGGDSPGDGSGSGGGESDDDDDQPTLETSQSNGNTSALVLVIAAVLGGLAALAGVLLVLLRRQSAS